MDTPASKRVLRKTTDNGIAHPGTAGIGVDAFGGTVIDPTKNVREMVLDEAAKRDALREADIKFNDLQFRMQEKLAEAETRRLDALAAQGQRYEERIAEDLKVGVKTTSDQLAGQLIKETGSLSNQITTMNTQFTNQITTLTTSFTNQVAALTASITPRLADLERFRWEVGGKTSVSDPATAAELIQIKAIVKSLSETKDIVSGTNKGHQDVTAWVVIGITGLFTFISIVLAGISLFHRV
jgi:hypothetical protein